MMKGLIFIPDISGFTNFVNSINIDAGVEITKELLNVIIDTNPLKLEISEIEGDAVLFYKIGKPIPLQDIFSAFIRMNQAFDIEYQRLKRLHNIEPNLSLKFILHYGDITVYDVKGFKKLFGETIIEAHQLLKNGNAISEYLLVTKDYVKASQEDIPDVLVNDFHFNFYASQIFRGANKIAFYLFSNIKKAPGTSELANEKKPGLANKSQWENAEKNEPMPTIEITNIGNEKINC